jgi:Methyltransferase FkbM domain
MVMTAMTRAAMGTALEKMMLGPVKRAIRKALHTAGYAVVPLPERIHERPDGVVGKPVGLLAPIEAPVRSAPATPIPTARIFAEVAALLDRIEPWSGEVPAGYVVNSLGILTDARFLPGREGPFEVHQETTIRPSLATWGEGFLELADWLIAARDARDQFVGMSLGAAYGAQLVLAWKALMAINPLPCRLVGVEPVPENCVWMRRHLAVNGIDPNAHWILQAALGPDNEPVLFPVGAPGSGATGCSDTNAALSRRTYANLISERGGAERVLENILTYNSTGLSYDLGAGFDGELKFVSAVTLRDVLTPFEHVDLLEVDIQHSEISVFPPFIDVLTGKVRRIHIGTHGQEAHDLLRALLLGAGWELVFDYAPDARHITEHGPLEMIDGVLSARNPALTSG